MSRLKATAVIVLAVLILILIFQNTGTVETQVLFWKVPLPRALALFIAAAFGYVLGAISPWLLRLRRSARERQAGKAGG